MTDIILPIVLVGIIILVVIIFGVTNRIIFKMATRNIKRRRANVAIVVAGLLVGTAIISSSLVVGDTMRYIFEKDVYDRLDLIDEVVASHSPQGYAYFNYSHYTILNNGLSAQDGIDGTSPIIMETVPVLNQNTSMPESRVNIIGFDPDIDRDFGLFIDVNGTSFDGSNLYSNYTIMNQRCAEELEAEVGNEVVIYYTTYIFNPQDPMKPTIIYMNTTLKILHIVKNEGKANYQSGMNLFVALDAAQTMFNKNDQINMIKISNEGGVEEGVIYTDTVKKDVEDIIQQQELNLEVYTVKQDGLEDAEKFSEMISEIFSIMGIFSIIAGVLLIVNIFVMLAEERKSEMGIARAIGMKRRHLVQMFLFEGLIYAVIAAFIGAFVGLGIAYLLILAFGTIFGGGGGIEIPFHFELSSIIMAFCIGLTITFITVFLASWIVSKLNIVRAIRNIPEPSITKATSRHIILGVFLTIIGVIMTHIGVSDLSAINFMTGPCLLLLGAAMLVMRIISPRLPFSIAGIGIIIWILQPFELVSDMTGGMEMFIMSGVMLVTGAIIVVMFNSDLVLRILTKIFGRRKSTVPILKTALSYPMKKKFRTGMTLAMFSLIIFTVAVISMITSMQTDYIEGAFEEQSGGYDIIAFTNQNTPLIDIRTIINNSANLTHAFTETSALSVAYTDVYVYGQDQNESVMYPIIGVDDEFIDQNDYTFYSIASEYDDHQEIWKAVKDNSSLVVIDGNAVTQQYGPHFGSVKLSVGDKIVVRNRTGQYSNKTVIGILDQSFFFMGIITTQEFLSEELGIQFPSMYLFDIAEERDVKSVSHELKKEFITYGMETTEIRDTIKEIMKQMTSIMTLMEAYLGLGLFVGIAGLGIITLRSVKERRQEIGVMRAIGFKKGMVAKSFLIEISFIALLGIAIGVILGISLSYHITNEFYPSGVSLSKFISLIPWAHILIITTFAYITTLLCTVSSALRASKIPPAEALRYVG